MTKPKSKVVTVRVTGPLAPYAQQFESLLTERGYTPLTRVRQLQVMVHLSKWMRARELDVGDLTLARVDEYLAQRRRDEYSSFRSRASVAKLLEVLARCGAPLVEPTLVRSGIDVLLAGYARFLRQERGLAASTTTAYVLRGRRFITGYGHGADLSHLETGDVTRAVLREAGTVSGRLGAVLRGGATFVATLRLSDRPDRHGPVRGVAAGDRAAALGPAAGHQHRRRADTAAFV